MVAQQVVRAKSIARGLSSSNVQIQDNHPSMCSMTLGRPFLYLTLVLVRADLVPSKEGVECAFWAGAGLHSDRDCRQAASCVWRLVTLSKAGLHG